MGRFARMTLVFAVIGAILLVLPFVPGIGTAVQFFGGAFWFGLLLHVFMLVVAVRALTGAIPRRFLLLPAGFYAVGVAAGLISDDMAARWIAGQDWLRVDGPVPAETRYLAFDSWSQVTGPGLRHAELRPERYGFAWAVLNEPPVPAMPRVSRRYAVAEGQADCPRATPRLDRIGDRCYATEPMDWPALFVRVGGPPDTRTPGIRSNRADVAVESHAWGRVFRRSLRIVLHRQDRQVEIGRMEGATVHRHGYVLFPNLAEFTLFAMPRSLTAGFAEGHTGEPGDTPRLIMEMLARLRGA